MAMDCELRISDGGGIGCKLPKTPSRTLPLVIFQKCLADMRPNYSQAWDKMFVGGHKCIIYCRFREAVERSKGPNWTLVADFLRHSARLCGCKAATIAPLVDLLMYCAVMSIWYVYNSTAQDDSSTPSTTSSALQ